MIEIVKEEILKKFGGDLVYTKDCKFLADTICEETGKRISTTTIRRLFGFLKSNTIPGKYTLNILSAYLGYQNWEHFSSAFDVKSQTNEKPKESWSEFYEKAFSFSKETYNMIVGQSGIPFNAVVNRDDSEERIQRFLNSSNSALSFVASGGYGKSTMLAKWFEKKWIEENSKDVVLFLNASMMISFLNADFKLDSWIQDQLRFTKKDSLKYFLDHPEDCESNIIFVIDALDEITYDNLKLERLFLQLKQFILNYKDSGNVKLIITSRNSTWGKFAMPFVVSGNDLKNCWFDLNNDLERVNEANLGVLNQREIQYVLDKTINQQYSSGLKIEELSYTHKRTISNPFFLELFVKLYSPERGYQNDEGQELMQEYIKNKIFYARYSEEKVDILHGILDLIQHGKNGTAAKKWELRDRYPVHLKTAGNYYLAYQELISYGIISEYTSTNEFNSYCKYVKITNEVLFESLIGISLIEANGGLNFELICKVDEEYEGYDLKNRLISNLLSSEFFNKEKLVLEDLLRLSEDTLSDPIVLETILNSTCFIGDDLEEFKEQLSSNKRISKLFSRSFGKKFSLNENNTRLLKVVAGNSADKDLRLRSLGLMLISSIHNGDTINADKYYVDLTSEEADSSCTGYTIAIRFAGILMYNYFIQNDIEDLELYKLFYYREMAFVNYEQSGSVDGEFEMILCTALIYMKSYHKVLQLVDDAEHLYYKNAGKKWSVNYRILQCFKIFAQQALGIKIESNQVEFLLQSMAAIKTSENYYLQIYYHSALSKYYAENNDILKVEEFFNRAIELSEYANYHLCTTALYRKMAQFYNSIGEKTRERICLAEEERILKNHVSNYSLEALLV